jgi:hypothetical protein
MVTRPEPAIRTDELFFGWAPPGAPRGPFSHVCRHEGRYLSEHVHTCIVVPEQGSRIAVPREALRTARVAVGKTEGACDCVMAEVDPEIRTSS